MADPGFDLRGGVDFVNWGGGFRKSKSFFLRVFGHISIKIMHKMNRERI